MERNLLSVMERNLSAEMGRNLSDQRKESFSRNGKESAEQERNLSVDLLETSSHFLYPLDCHVSYCANHCICMCTYQAFKSLNSLRYLEWTLSSFFPNKLSKYSASAILSDVLDVAY